MAATQHPQLQFGALTVWLGTWCCSQCRPRFSKCGATRWAVKSTARQGTSKRTIMQPTAVLRLLARSLLALLLQFGLRSPVFSHMTTLFHGRSQGA